jgi:predicted dehydrogenase
LRRRLLRVAGFASGALAGAWAYRYLSGGRGERVDVYFDDGSFVTFGAGSIEGDRLLPLARRVLIAARPVA